MSIALSIFGCYPLVIILLGVIGNIITINVCFKTKKNPTFILIQYLSANNIISLFYWNLSHFTMLLNFDLINYSMFVCKVGGWIQFSSLQTSAWILVFITLERYLSFKIKLWKEKYFMVKRAHLAGIFICAAIYLINLNVLFTFGRENYIKGSNETKYVQCYATDQETQWMDRWNKVHSYLYSFVPFVLITILNALLIYHLYQVKTQLQNVQNSTLLKNQIAISTTILAMTILFIVATSPGAIISQFYSTLIMSDSGKIILFAGDDISFSYHAYTIIILCLSNKEFLRKLRNNTVETIEPTFRVSNTTHIQV